jgi:hypothetical protein
MVDVDSNADLGFRTLQKSNSKIRNIDFRFDNYEFGKRVLFFPE